MTTVRIHYNTAITHSSSRAKIKGFKQLEFIVIVFFMMISRISKVIEHVVWLPVLWESLTTHKRKPLVPKIQIIISKLQSKDASRQDENQAEETDLVAIHVTRARIFELYWIPVDLYNRKNCQLQRQYKTNLSKWGWWWGLKRQGNINRFIYHSIIRMIVVMTRVTVTNGGQVIASSLSIDICKKYMKVP